MSQISGASLPVYGQRIVSADPPTGNNKIYFTKCVDILHLLLRNLKSSGWIVSDLVWLIEDCEGSLKLGAWGVLKVLYILRHNLTVTDQETLKKKEVIYTVNLV